MTLDALTYYSSRMGDALSGLMDGFEERLREQMERRKDLVEDLDYESARRLGRQGADAALAPLAWAQIVGDRWDTSTTAEFLAISRQALFDRVRRGSLLGIAGRGTTWYPTWQFDLTKRQARPVVARVIKAFEETLGDRPDPLAVASWAQTVQSSLDGMTPIDWISSSDRDEERVVVAARRTAAKLAA